MIMTKNIAKLPELAFVENTIHCTGPHGEPKLLAIRRGEQGYCPIYTTVSADHMNEGKATKAQAAAMLAGSMWGWDTPAADADRYDEEGNLK